ncbi:hypothetical protein [Brevifollis gellanilyticus]|uniref:Uncharacterized protein n=1 Tax=Brevifollis gellanilyticus TaxID=748831 RepID=A0A512M7G1_9BACT|nr:hypothetical protein [Brevifollis gellanilyticus]GEP42678.1 hypothetical protein BGE01nite_19690 [Brevifollis gellanilyticus]
MNLHPLFCYAVITLALAGSGTTHAAERTPPLVPGKTFIIKFPDMPPTFAEMYDPKGIQPMMSVFLPQNYDPQRQHPLLIFLGGGSGTRGYDPTMARKITEETDFVCVDLPLFKEKLDPPAAGNATSRLIIQANDGKLMWSLYKTMFARLEAAVPNIDPAHRVMGGSSNGAHATAALIDQSEGEIARRFSAFFFVEGGGRLQHYELLKGKAFLMLYGSAQSGKRAAEIHEAATAAGAQATLHEMKGVGHGFPESQYPAVRKWLGLGSQPSSEEEHPEKTQRLKEVGQNKTGTVKEVDIANKRLVVSAPRELTFSVTDTTQITQGDIARKLADIKTGDKVSVDYRRDGEARIAHRIDLQSSSSPRPPAATDSAPTSSR